MAKVTDLRAGLAARLNTIQGFTGYRRWPNDINMPCGIVDLTGAEPEQTMGRGELTLYRFDVEVLYSLAGGWENAQDQLDVLLATSSTGGVFGAIAADRTLGGVAHSTFIRALPRAYERRVLDEQREALAATVPLEVWAS